MGCFMKYSYEEKLTAVLSVVRGQHSVSSASKHFGISYTPLSRWIARYKEFGEAGLRIRQYTYSGDFKLSAIRHMHENHLSLTETTAKFGIYNESTLSKWERIYYEEGESGLYRDNRGRWEPSLINRNYNHRKKMTCESKTNVFAPRLLT